ncbi:ATP-binding protein [Streptomyces sp. CA-106110]|uniref:ATP-binding protein n=1 Tax=Streptomyces sp. CA-106110 TaxID=3240044 RepID=UPI003D91F58D
MPPATPVPVLREYPAIFLPGDPTAPRRARTRAREGLTVIGWQGDVVAATEVVAALVENAVTHAVMPDLLGEGVTVNLSITQDGRLIIDVLDPKPAFPDFERVRMASGCGLWHVQQLQAEVTWFTPPDCSGKTVRATMLPGPVAL